MAIKYLYIDDEPDSRLEPFVDVVCRASSDLEIEIDHPQNFNHDLEKFYTKLKNYDGLILDWRLDEIAGSNGQTSPFRAGMLAQELRTRSTEGNLKGMPIVLWSTNKKLGGSYVGDLTSHDLFDMKHLKEYVVDNPTRVYKQLVALSNGYKNLGKFRADSGNVLQKALGLSDKKFSLLDIRLVKAFLAYKIVAPSHEYARFILNQCIDHPGILLNEQLLAAKLGIDIEKSPDWLSLCKNYLSGYEYRGVFHEAWPRWWWADIQQWWKQIGNSKPISRYSAEEKISFIATHTNLDRLFVAEPIKSYYSSYYDTICQHYERPLDKLDGIMVNEPEPLSWQERRYLSIEAVLSREYEDEKKWEPHPIEHQRLDEIRQVN